LAIQIERGTSLHSVAGELSGREELTLLLKKIGESLDTFLKKSDSYLRYPLSFDDPNGEGSFPPFGQPNGTESSLIRFGQMASPIRLKQLERHPIPFGDPNGEEGLPLFGQLNGEVTCPPFGLF